MMNRGRVIRGRVDYRVEYRVNYRILGEFLLESGEKKLKMGLSRIFI